MEQQKRDILGTTITASSNYAVLENGCCLQIHIGMADRYTE
jgi:hypothetical protein